MLLSSKAGSYSVSNLLNELKIRVKHLGEANDKIVGASQLIDELKKSKVDAIISNYSFKKKEAYYTVYINNDNDQVVGLVRIRRND